MDAETWFLVPQIWGRNINATAALICDVGPSIQQNSLDAWQATYYKKLLAK